MCGHASCGMVIRPINCHRGRQSADGTLHKCECQLRVDGNDENCELTNPEHAIHPLHAGYKGGMEATADLPLANLRQQLEVNLVAQISVTQVPLRKGASTPCATPCPASVMSRAVRRSSLRACTWKAAGSSLCCQVSSPHCPVQQAAAHLQCDLCTMCCAMCWRRRSCRCWART